MVMMVTNEQVSRAVTQSPQVLQVALTDASTYLRNTQRQIVFVVAGKLEDAVLSISSDLDSEWF